MLDMCSYYQKMYSVLCHFLMCQVFSLKTNSVSLSFVLVRWCHRQPFALSGALRCGGLSLQANALLAAVIDE